MIFRWICSVILTKYQVPVNNFHDWWSLDAVRYKDLLKDVYTDLSNLLKSLGGVCAIVYCLERSTCDVLSNHLLKAGISSAGKKIYTNLFSNFRYCFLNISYVVSNPYLFFLSAYHAGLNSKLRTAVLDDWLSSRIQVVVATIAFGYHSTSNAFDTQFIMNFQFLTSFMQTSTVFRFKDWNLTSLNVLYHLSRISL